MVKSNKAPEKPGPQPLHGILIHANAHTVAAALDYIVVNVETHKPAECEPSCFPGDCFCGPTV